jgi:hypothetical protein
MNAGLTSIAAAAPAIAMLCMFACLIGGVMLIAKRRDTNVAIWTL